MPSLAVYGYLLFPLFLSVVLGLTRVPTSFKLQKQGYSGTARTRACFQIFAGPGELDEFTRERIDAMIKTNKVLLFMKGNKLFPQW